MTAEENDARTLAWLRGNGPGTVTVKQVATETGMTRAIVRACILALGERGLVCLMSDAADTRYMIRHLHAEPGDCQDSLGAVVVEVHPDQR